MLDPRDLPDGVKYAVDGISAATVLGALAQVLPALASLLTVVWMAIRIWETQTVQGWLGRPAKPGRDGDG